MEDKKNTTAEEITEEQDVAAEEPVLMEPDDGHKPYVPRPKYQIVLAWIMAVIVALGFILWLLEIATAGSLFGLLN